MEEFIDYKALSDQQLAAIRHLEQQLGYTFVDRESLYTALRHRSYVFQYREVGEREDTLEDNQRLEFLGDAVLSLCVSTLLIKKFPLEKEGVLSRMRAGLVNEVQLSEMARDLGVPHAVFLGRGEEATGGRDKNSILADALEAVMAAIYLDSSFERILKIVAHLWGDLIDRSSTDDLLKDFKTRLQEYTQKNTGEAPEYRITGSDGPDHARIFKVTLVLEGKSISTGHGRSKKEAEQAAAKAGLKILMANTPTEG